MKKDFDLIMKTLPVPVSVEEINEVRSHITAVHTLQIFTEDV